MSSYAEFWPSYLRDHSRSGCRALHYLGTTAAIACLVLLVVTGDLGYLAGAAVGGYGCAWIGHWFVERNRPATFTHPMWSLYSDVRMYVYALSGRLARELERAGAD